MNNNEFNKKYKDFLEEGFSGLEIDIPEVTEWLDKKFEQFILKPGFKYSQIKVKFGMGRFYCKGISFQEINDIENYISNI